MLLSFEFENFKSFKDANVLDLTAAKITEYDYHVRQYGKERVLPVAAIYGANASGKSNVYQAMQFMTYYVIASFNFGGDNTVDSINQYRYPKPPAFTLAAANQAKPTVFEVYFIDNNDKNNKIYNYGFTLDAKGIVEEWLNVKNKTGKEYKKIFYRSKEKLEFDKLKKNLQENLKISLQAEVLAVSLGAKLKIKELNFVREWFLKNEFTDFGDPFINLFLANNLPQNFAVDKNVQDKVLKYLHTFDSSICGFKVKQAESVITKSPNDAEGGVIYNIETEHKMLDSNETVTMSLQNESSGTLKMFALYPYFEKVLSNGGILFVDELNARLHPLLVRTCIQMFLNPELNPDNAQLIFTTHDVWQIENDLLRRDEIWFTQKSDQGVSELYSLADFKGENGDKIRKDEAYAKNYLLGCYGAIPKMKNFSIAEGNDND